MATFTGTSGNDVADAGTGTLTGFTGGTLAELQDATGDVIDGGAGNDSIVGGAGNDTITGGTGTDTLFGGDGNDVFIVDPAGAVPGETYDGGSGIDTIQTSGSGYIDLSGLTPGSTLNTITSIEQLVFAGSFFTTTYFDSRQIGSGLSNTLSVTGNAFSNIVHIIMRVGNTLDLSGWTFTNWTTVDDQIYINGTSGNDTITGSSGDDQINGGAGVDTQFAGSGNDRFNISPASDLVAGETFDGGTGSDTFFLGSSTGLYDFTGTTVSSVEQIIFNTSGLTTVRFAASQLGGGIASNFAVVANTGSNSRIEIDLSAPASVNLSGWTFSGWTGGRTTVNGSTGDDTIVGTTQNDSIVGGAGNDTITGGLGADTLDGGEGSDFYVFSGGDVVAGEVLSDSGSAGTDTLRALGSTNFTSGGSFTGFEAITFGGSSSFYFLEFKSSQLGPSLQINGNPLATNIIRIYQDVGGIFSLADWNLADWQGDQIILSDKADTSDTLTGSIGGDVFGPSSISGDDVLDYFDGHSGFDYIDYTNYSANLVVTLDGANWAVVLGSGSTVGMSDNVRNIEGFTGGGGNDVITGDGLSNSIRGRGGNDSIVGGGGDDSLLGDEGNDTLVGGVGNDTYEGRIGDDTIISMDGVEVIDGDQGFGTSGQGNDTLTLSRASATANLTFNLTNIANTTTLVGDGTTVINVETFNITGGSGNDNFATLGGDDTLDGGAGNDTLNGGAGNDQIFGGAGLDSIQGGAGNDTIALGTHTVSGREYAHGGTGNDTMTADVGDSQLSGEDGDDVLSFVGVGNNPGKQFWAYGGNNNDSLTGGDGNDWLQGDAGNDTLVGGAGNDTLFGSAGADNVSAGAGDDAVTSDDNAGADVLDGGADFDWLTLNRSTNASANVVDFSNSAVLQTLGDGTTVVNFERITFTSGSGADTITSSNHTGGSNSNIVSGGMGNDTLTAAANGATLQGDAGDDNLFGSAVIDNLYGGADNDTIALGTNTAAGRDYGYGGTGNDTMTAAAGDSQLSGEDGDDVLTFVGGGNNAGKQFWAYGGNNNDSLTGGDGNDWLQGDAGNDTLVGGAGNDTLLGSAGADNVSGGSGNDTVTSDDNAGADVLDGGDDYDWLTLNRSTSSAASTVDFSNSSALQALGDGTTVVNFERITFTSGSGADSIISTNDAGGNNTNLVYGGGGNDTLTAAANGATLQGDAGDDSLVGSAAIDILYGGADNDIIALGGNSNAGSSYQYGYGGAGNDTLSAGLGNSQVFGEGGNDVLTYVGGGNNAGKQFQAYGGTENDSITGGDGNDWLQGDQGDDTISGGAGNDTLYGGAGNDVISSGAGQDLIDGGTEADRLTLDRAGATANLTFNLTSIAATTTLVGDGTTVTGVETFNILSGSGNDFFAVLGGDDTLDGGAGNDTFDGGAGNDSLAGGSGNDLIIDSSGTSTNIDGGAGDDRIQIYSTLTSGTVSGGADTDTLWAVGGGNLSLLTITGIEILETNDIAPFGTQTAFASQFQAFSKIWVNSANANAMVSLQFVATGSPVVVDLSSKLGDSGGRGAKIVGSSDDETITAGLVAANNIAGGGGNDQLIGGAGNDTLAGGAGNDTLVGGAGADSLDGGEGSDTYNFGVGDVGIGESLNDTGTSGTDIIQIASSVVNATVAFHDGSLAGIEGLAFTGGGQTAQFTAVQLPSGLVVTGTSGTQGIVALNATIYDASGWSFVDWTNGVDSILIAGTNAADGITGSSQDDYLNAHGGADTLSGGQGADLLVGGAGNDSIDGGAGNDTLTGGVDDDTLIGGEGADQLDGGEGSDEYRILQNSHQIGDVFADSGASGTDTIVVFESGVDLGQFSTISGIEALRVLGNTIVHIGASPFPSNLAVEGENGTNQNISTQGLENFTAAGWSFTNWEATDRVTYFGTSNANTFTGSSGSNYFVGFEGADTMVGAAFGDTMVGGVGNDVFEGDAGSDRAIFEGSRSTFTIERIEGVGTTWRITDTDGSTHGDEGTDTLSNVETLFFENGSTTLTVAQLIGALSDSDTAANSVAEGASIGATVGLAALASDGNSEAVTYSLSSNPGGFFAIGDSSGVVTVAAQLDYETATSHTITVRATSADGSFTEKSFTINVTNSAPSAAVDADGAAGGVVAETATNGTVVGITASSADPGGGAVTYSLFDNAGGRFVIDSGTGIVTVANASLLDSETAANHSITVRATDSSGAFSDQTFSIAVTNDAPSVPTDTDGASGGGISEATFDGEAVGITANAVDPGGGAITYSLADDAGGRFAIDASSGIVSVRDSSLIDFEANETHTITVRATDAGGAFSDQMFEISVSNEAPSTPIDADGPAGGDISEATFDGATVGITANAADPGGGELIYSLTDDAGGRFAIDSATGVVTVLDASLIDFEANEGHTIVVRASDPSGAFSEESFVIAVGDVNEAPTAVALANTIASLNENTSTGTRIKVAEIVATDDALGINTLAVTGADAAFFEIIGTELFLKAGTRLDYERKASYSVAVTVDDGTVGGSPDATSATYVLNVADINPETVNGTAGADTIVGGALGDTFFGLGSNDSLVGGAGNDILDGGSGLDTLVGGTGNDVYVVDQASDQVVETGGDAADRVRTSVNYTLSASSLVEILETVSAAASTAINLTGNLLANAIFGNNGANVLTGGAGIDTLTGGAGNDTYVVDNAADSIVENAGQGSLDVVRSSVTFTLQAGDQIERLETTNATGTGAMNLTGNEFAQTITGNAGANRLTGAAGNDSLSGSGGADTLVGGAGNDTLAGGAGSDVFIFNVALGATNRDTISDFSNAGQNDVIHLENTGAGLFTLLASGALNAAAFKANATGTATDSNDRIIYNTTTGALLYDTNGNVAGGATQFAILSTKPALTAADFFVI